MLNVVSEQCERLEVLALRQQVQQLTKQRDNCAEEARAWEHRARQCVEQINAQDAIEGPQGDRVYHYWMPGEDNCLDHIGCPVVIQPQWLRDLLDEAEERGRLRERRQLLAGMVTVLLQETEATIRGLPGAAKRGTSLSYIGKALHRIAKRLLTLFDAPRKEG